MTIARRIGYTCLRPAVESVLLFYVLTQRLSSKSIWQQLPQR